MRMHTLTFALLGALWLSPAIAQEQPSWYPNRYDIQGSVAKVDHQNRTMIIDEQRFAFSPALRVRTKEGVKTARHLEPGTNVGITGLDPDRPVMEIWVMPRAAD